MAKQVNPVLKKAWENYQQLRIKAGKFREKGYQCDEKADRSDEKAARFFGKLDERGEM